MLTSASNRLHRPPNASKHTKLHRCANTHLHPKKPATLGKRPYTTHTIPITSTHPAKPSPPNTHEEPSPPWPCYTDSCEEYGSRASTGLVVATTWNAAASWHYSSRRERSAGASEEDVGRYGKEWAGFHEAVGEDVGGGEEEYGKEVSSQERQKGTLAVLRLVM